MNRRLISGTLAAITGISSVVVMMPATALASTSYEQRKKILVTANVIDSFDADKGGNTVTRAEFAKMLVRASSFNNSVSAYNTVAVFNDVPRDNEYASYIRLAAEQGWLSSYLGGNFKPSEPIKLHEAVKATLSLLGYTAENFTGNQVANRLAKSQAIGLTNAITKTTTDPLTYEDCVNLFYNLMKTNTASNENATQSDNTIYGKLLGFSISSDHEINMLDTLTANLHGPVLLKSGRKLSTVIPFASANASCYLNGETSSVDEIEDEAASAEAVVVYYNTSSKVVYAYSSLGNNQGTMGCAKGTLDAIYYSSTSVMTPTSIEVNGQEYLIGSNDTNMQYAFSIYGSQEVGDEVTIVWQFNTSSNDYSVIAYVD